MCSSDLSTVPTWMVGSMLLNPVLVLLFHHPCAGEMLCGLPHSITAPEHRFNMEHRCNGEGFRTLPRL